MTEDLGREKDVLNRKERIKSNFHKAEHGLSVVLICLYNLEEDCVEDRERVKELKEEISELSDKYLHDFLIQEDKVERLEKALEEDRREEELENDLEKLESWVKSS